MVLQPKYERIYYSRDRLWIVATEELV